MSIDLNDPRDIRGRYPFFLDPNLAGLMQPVGVPAPSPTFPVGAPTGPQAAVDAFELRDHLPEDVVETLEESGVDVGEVDTPMELRELLQMLNQSEGTGDPLDGLAEQKVDDVGSAAGEMDVSELLALLIDYLESGYHQQDQAAPQASMSPRGFSQGQPVSNNWGGGGHSGGGSAGGGGSGGSSGGTAPVSSPSGAVVPSNGTVEGAPNVAGFNNLSAEQKANAQTIIDVGRQMGASDRDIQIALMTAMQESGLRNLNYGDRDSQGLFQQRPSQGWGSVEQITNPEYSAGKFYELLLRIPNRDSMRMTEAAQAVQRSAFPEAYAKHEGVAAALMQNLA